VDRPRRRSTPGLPKATPRFGQKEGAEIHSAKCSV
jgi:hypothetical protein